MKIGSHTALKDALSGNLGDLTNLVIQYHPFCLQETPHNFIDFVLDNKDRVFGVTHNGDVIANDKLIGNIEDYTNTNEVMSIEVVSTPSVCVIAIGFRKYTVLQFWSRHGFQRHSCLPYPIQNLFYYNQALYFHSWGTIRRFHLQTYQVIVIHREPHVKQFVCLPNKEILVLTDDGRVYRKSGNKIEWLKVPKPIHSFRLFDSHLVILNGNQYIYCAQTKAIKQHGFHENILQTLQWHNIVMIRTKEELSFWCWNVYRKYDPIDEVVHSPFRHMWSISCGLACVGKDKIVLATSDTLITLQ